MINSSFLITADWDDEVSPEAFYYRAALKWLALGYNVVPLSRDGSKHPAIRWKELQDRRVTREDLLGCYALFREGLGFITGEISGAVVIDTDGPQGEALLREFEQRYGRLPKTLIVRSGSGRGLHRHFRHPGSRVKTKANSTIKIDIKGDRGFCVLPPSAHKSGGMYELIVGEPLAELPAGLVEFIESKAATALARAKELGRALKRGPAGTASGIMPTAAAIGRPVPMNRINLGIIKTMLDALPDAYADDYQLWFSVGCALRSFDGGRFGVALWKSFSMRSPTKAEATDFDAKWDALTQPYEGKPITLGWLVHQAQSHGWLWPRRWDRTAMILDKDGTS